MKKIYSFLPLLFLLTLVFAASFAIYNSSTKHNISKQDLSNDTNLMNHEYRLNLSQFSLPSLFDKDEFFSINDLKNDQNRYSVVNFFASWCTTCLGEHDILMRLSKEKSINLYGVAWHDFRDGATVFLEKNGNPFIKTAIDSKGLFTKILDIKAVPETILVDSLGQVVLRYEGNLNEEDLFEILNFVNRK